MPLYNPTSGGAVTSANITDGEIVNADINASAAIAASKLALSADNPRIAVGRYTALCPSLKNIGTSALTVNEPQAVPFIVAVPTAIDRIGIEVTTLGATSVVRLGVFSDAAGIPVTKIFDAGTIDAGSTGFKEITISQTLPAGRYWAVATAQTAGCTVKAQDSDLVSHGTAATVSGFIIGMIKGPSTSGAYGSTFGAVADGAGAGPRILVRGA